MFFCCLNKTSEEQLTGLCATIKNLPQILLEFVREEQKLGLKSISFFNISDKIVGIANNIDIDKDELK